MNGNHVTNKLTGSTLTAEEWNALALDVNELGQGGGNSQGGGTSNVTITDDTVSDPSAGVSIVTEVSQIGSPKVFELTKKKKGVNTTLVSGNNINFEPRESVVDNGVETKGGNIAFKPGDDIEFCSHHRVPSSLDEVNVKVIDGSDNPVKLQIQAGSLTLTAKNRNLTKKKGANGTDVSGTTDNDYLYGSEDNAEVFDINVTKEYKLSRGIGSKKSGKGYLKVRAQAIDLRCEEHGGIAIQPKGYDGDGNMNKIKFEHGGGDGLEFGTFNTEKTSIFTDEYRFNKDGVWKMSRRKIEASGKTISNEGTLGGKLPTGIVKYKKNNSTNQLNGYESADDFYDFIDITDEQCTTKDIIKTAYALNNYPGVHTKITNGGSLEIGTGLVYKVTHINELPSEAEAYPSVYTGAFLDPFVKLVNGKYVSIPAFSLTRQYYSASDLAEIIKFYPTGTDLSQVDENTAQAEITFDGSATIYINFGNVSDSPALVNGYAVYNGDMPSGLYKLEPQPIPSIKIDSGAELKLGGILDFGSSFNFGETDNGIEVQYKLTKKNASKDCGIIKVVGVNNHATNNLTVEGVTIAPRQTGVIAQCSMLDIIKLVNYMKTNNQGPWQV